MHSCSFVGSNRLQTQQTHLGRWLGVQRTNKFETTALLDETTAQGEGKAWCFIRWFFITLVLVKHQFPEQKKSHLFLTKSMVYLFCKEFSHNFDNVH